MSQYPRAGSRSDPSASAARSDDRGSSCGVLVIGENPHKKVCRNVCRSVPASGVKWGRVVPVQEDATGVDKRLVGRNFKSVPHYDNGRPSRAPVEFSVRCSTN